MHNFVINSAVEQLLYCSKRLAKRYDIKVVGIAK